MLKKDKMAFLDFVSGDTDRMRLALAHFASQEAGHFEDHPPSLSLVRSHITDLVRLWNSETDPECRSWIVQFIADAGVVDSTLKPIVLSALRDVQGQFLPTLLYLVGTMPVLFTDIGPELSVLARHSDREVRWRVAYVISKMKILSPEMRTAVAILRNDRDPTTEVYVQECEKRA